VPGSIGLMSAILGIGAGAGIVLAGVIVQHLSYHWLFWLPLIAVVGAGLATWRWVPESPIKAPGRVHWRGAALLSAGLVCVLVAVSETSTWGWGSPKTLGLLAVGLLVLVAWVAAELRASDPLVDMRVMRRRGVWATNLVAILLGFGMFGSFILIPQLAELPTSTGFGFGEDVTGAGLLLLPSTIMMLLVGPFAGRLERRFGSKPPLIAGCVAAAAAFAVFALAHAHRWELAVGSALLGIGIGLAFAAMANLIVQAVPPDQTGVATGMNTIMRSIGGALGAQIAATILAGNLAAASGLPTEHAFTLAFGVSAIALVAAVAAGLVIPGRSQERAPSGAGVASPAASR
jgi:MFS family permease